MTPAHDSRALLVARGVGKVYRMGDVEVPALRGVDLTLDDGELLVILGPSGSGKSTLLNILGGLDTASEGTLEFEGVPLRGDDDEHLTRYRRAHVGFVFQFYNLIPSLTALENVALVTEIADNPLSPKDALALVDLQDRADHFPAQMSGGQQQRVAIARAIVKRPRLLLCDEPTGALDAQTGRIVLAALARANRELGATTAIITHNAAIGAMGDRVITVADGRIAREQTNATRMDPVEVVW
jgi:putative ABC transport system ATP-binding protein